MANWIPDFKPGDEVGFGTLKSYSNIPAVAYHSTVGDQYYALNNPLAPYAEKVTLSVELLGFRQEVQNEGDLAEHTLKALRYSSNKGVSEVYGIMGGQYYGSPFLDGGGRVLFFGFVYNPDVGADSSQVVNRVATLGLSYARRPSPKGGAEQWGNFVFFRDLDSLGLGFPIVENRALDFQIFSSTDHGPYKDIVVEAGSPANYDG